MISHATQLVQSGQFKSPYGYICVDEFQDISVGRAKLLQALQAARKDAQVFSVGDDWQSIFRFAGSDIGVMQDFVKYFGTAERVDLKTTYRCSAEIAKVSADFICKNQLQLKKDVKAIFSTRNAGILIGVQTQDKESLLSEALRIIDEDETSDHRKTVFLLGRYKHERPKYFLKLCRDFPSLNIKFYTIHGAKGLECDYVIVLSMVSGRLGFPSEREDDPVLSMVLAKPDDFPNAEERRLFYVALTRARKRTVLLTDLSYPSTFIRELITGAYEVDYFGRKPTDEVSCPECVEGILRIKNSEKGVFYGCANYPYCLHTEQACPHCSKGLPRIRRKDLVCTFCDQQVEPCPKKLCGGWLTLKTGRYGNFWGCTNYWSEKQCTYTRNAD
jgi:DNA helicase-4